MMVTNLLIIALRLSCLSSILSYDHFQILSENTINCSRPVSLLWLHAYNNGLRAQVKQAD